MPKQNSALLVVLVAAMLGGRALGWRFPASALSRCRNCGATARMLSSGGEGSREATEARIFELAGRRFNVNSPQQVADLVFKERGLAPPPGLGPLPSGRMPATVEVLNAMAGDSGSGDGSSAIKEPDRELLRLIVDWKRGGGGGGGGGVAKSKSKAVGKAKAKAAGAAAQEGEAAPPGVNALGGFTATSAPQAAALEGAMSAAADDGKPARRLRPAPLGVGATVVDRMKKEAAVAAATAQAVVARPPEVLLVDGTYMLHRAHHGMARGGTRLTGPSGQPVGALLAFCNCLGKAVLSPAVGGVRTRVVVAFDAPGASYRSEVYADYKAKRKETDRDLRDQFVAAWEACEAYGIPRVRVDGFEGDDLIATLATAAAAAGMTTLIASADKDLAQLVGDKVQLLDVFKGERMGPVEVRKKHGVGPEQVRDFLALTGDASDNLPGVRSVGPISAAKLLAKHGTLEAVLAAAASVPEEKRTKLEKALVASEGDALLTRELVELAREVPLPFTITEVPPYVPPHGKQLEALQAFFDRHGLKDLGERTTSLLASINGRRADGAEAMAAAVTATALVTPSVVVPLVSVLRHSQDEAGGGGVGDTVHHGGNSAHHSGGNAHHGGDADRHSSRGHKKHQHQSSSSGGVEEAQDGGGEEIRGPGYGGSQEKAPRNERLQQHEQRTRSGGEAVSEGRGDLSCRDI